MTGADEQAVAAAQSLRALECDTVSQDTADAAQLNGIVSDAAEPPSKSSRHTVAETAGGSATAAAASAAAAAAAAAAGPGPSGGADTSAIRHIATEQRRRNRINEGYSALRDLIPSKDKTDKATFLMQVVDYVRQLQSVLQQLMESGTVSKLPEDLQWSIRLLMPRMPGTAAAPVAGVTPVAQAATVAAGPVQAVPALAAAAPSAAQPGGLGFGNLAALAQLHVLQQLMAQHGPAGLPAQLTSVAQMPAGNAGMVLSPEMLAVVAQHMQGLVPALATPAAPAQPPVSAPPPCAAAAAPPCSAASAAPQGGASGESSSSQEEGGVRGGAPKPARKGLKVRRHTTAARFTSPPADWPGSLMEGLAGRPANGD